MNILLYQRNFVLCGYASTNFLFFQVSVPNTFCWGVRNDGINCLAYTSRLVEYTMRAAAVHFGFSTVNTDYWNTG